MSHADKWVISSSGHHMFISFNVHHVSNPGFTAKMHYGNEIKNIRNYLHQKIKIYFQSIVDLL